MPGSIGDGPDGSDDLHRMIFIRFAQAAEDKSRRVTIDARHQVDSLAYQLERRLKDVGDKVPPHEKSRSQGLIW